ncbi:MAG TPA: hypothetical protein VHK69_20950 [Chitinophagaceae bacterium]|jgi:hypothetical protein|nr:hypothetical protein [Chitinophagaceae bacterium]
MEQRPDPAAFYAAQKEQLEKEAAVLRRNQSRFGWLRLGIILVTAVLAFWLFNESVGGGIALCLGGIALFLFVVSRDADNNRQLVYTRRRLSDIEGELAALRYEYRDRYDGADHLPPQHPYAHDLDLFGPASLFQYVNRARSEQGRSRMAECLLHALPVTSVEDRQAAVKELAQQPEWGQRFQALAAEVPVTRTMEKKVRYWIGEPATHFTGAAWAWILPLYTCITVGTALATILDIIPESLFTGMLLLYIIFSFSLSKPAVKAYQYLSGIVGEVGTLSRLIDCVEAPGFQASLLKQLQENLKTGGHPAHREIRALQDILNRFDARLNVFVFLFLNAFLLWDVRQMRALNAWKARNRDQVPHWFSVLAEMEVLTSFATLSFNQPRWAFPRWTEKHLTWESRSLGHPLIPAGQRVTSDFVLRGQGKIALVTGSNMAGKSTFLRSLGVNTVLAGAGAPVCAGFLELSPVELMSSMRIADNLAENTSTFYAELKKLKDIISEVNRKAPVFVLLDEILRGTNSLDRHTGSEALMRQLIRQGAVAVIATHDLELARLESEYPGALENYHFDVQVAGEELYFDYRLKEGVCTSLNASILMKKIGIEL